MSLSKVDKLVHVAIIEGNIIIAKLLRTLQRSPKAFESYLAFTDGKAIYVSDKFWELSLGEQYFIINHEFLHIILKHPERIKDKNRKIYNIAADIIINKLLVDRGRKIPNNVITYSTFKVPKTLETTDEIYNFLLENQTNEEDCISDIIPDFEINDNIPQEIQKEIEILVKEELQSNYSDQARKEKITSVPQIFHEKIDWFNDLMIEIGRLAIRTNIKTYNRPSRVKITGCILKGGYINQYIPKLNIIIDVSGSMSNEPLKIAAKINVMKDYLKVFKPKYYWLNETYGEIKDITNIPLGGGTDLSNVVHIKDGDMNVLITDCEDEKGIQIINNSTNRFYVITNNFNTKIIENYNHKVFKTINF